MDSLTKALRRLRVTYSVVRHDGKKFIEVDMSALGDAINADLDKLEAVLAAQPDAVDLAAFARAQAIAATLAIPAPTPAPVTDPTVPPATPAA